MVTEELIRGPEGCEEDSHTENLLEEPSMPENSKCKDPEVDVHRIEGSQCGCEQGKEGKV